MNAKVDGRSARGRPRFGWMDGVKKALNVRGAFLCVTDLSRTISRRPD